MLTTLLASAMLFAQVRDAPVRPRADSVIAGVVVSADDEARPVRKARVTCSGPDVPGHTAITDDGGRFVFDGLRAGRYTITASKPSWVTMAYGAKRAMRPGVAIPLAGGQKATIVLRLPHGSVITGVVLDENNEPAANAAVSVFRYGIVNGGRRLAAAGGAATDDRGAYRIYGLPPGDYIVGAEGRGAARSTELRLTSDADVRHASAVHPGTPPPRDRSVALAMTYFPGSPIASQAGLISLQAGEERSGVDFALQLVPTARVEGTVSLAEGGTPPGTEVNLISSAPVAVPGAPLDSVRTIRTDTDGRFAFANVSPGQYSLLARAIRPITKPDGSSAGAPQILWASTELAIEGEPVTGLGLSLEPGLSITGQVRFEGASIARPADLRAIRVRVVPAQVNGPVAFAPAEVSVSPDGRFTVPGVTPGRYRLTASFPGSGRRGGWLLKSITANGQDALNGSFALQPNQHVLDAAVTFTDRLAQLAGSLQTAGAPPSDYTVVLFPADQALWVAQSRRIQNTRPAADGAYVFRDLVAGEYLIAAVDDVETGEWYDPAFLQRIAPSAVKVTIRDREQKTQDIRSGYR
jgi:protocatechuate 3,4-dioxygenase beta subunit